MGKTEARRRIAAYIAMVVLTIGAAYADAAFALALWFFTTIGLPPLIALIAGRKPVRYGVLTNIFHWFWYLPLALFSPHYGSVGPESALRFVASSIGFLAIMVFLAVIPCWLLGLVLPRDV